MSVKLPQPMRQFIQLAVLIVILGLVSFSCSNNDHEPEPSCLFTGKTSTYTTSTYKDESSTDVVIDDDKRLVSARRVENSESFNHWKRGRTIDYLPKYNADGFLTQMVVTTVDWYEGTIGFSYQYNYQYFLKFKTETTQTTDYQYKSGFAVTATTKTTVHAQGDNYPPDITESETVKTYVYDSKNVLVSALTTTASGSSASTFKNGIIASEVLKNAKGEVINERLYNESGQNISDKNATSLFEFTFDSKGNRKSVKLTLNGQPNYLQEYTYDDHVNPETTIPVIFKGIPEQIVTVQTTDGVNNMTGEKFTSYVGAPNRDVAFLYEYNADGQPASWTQKPMSAGETGLVTFRYKCQ